ncbi:hypothetical protein QQP08_009827 [Theobroma cacao]|nr:hypothetical protein QQP08_009827 [Theobroma cacao]
MNAIAGVDVEIMQDKIFFTVIKRKLQHVKPNFVSRTKIFYFENNVLLDHTAKLLCVVVLGGKLMA